MQKQSAHGHGAFVQAGGVRFSLWAPHASRVELRIDPDRRLPMEPVGGGRFERFVEGLGAGATYSYALDGGDPLPDPASRFQPLGVHGPSQVVDPASYRWTDHDWRGVAQQDLVFYELHVGTFSPEGTFRGVEPRLADLKALGVTAIELMPLANFPGRRNWGYDPADFFAPAHAYGTPEELRSLVDAAHRVGLAVFLDVIYNHFGPDGAYAATYAPFHSPKHHTPWGQGINLDDDLCEGVRAFFIDNALHWLDEYHFDGLRLDAVDTLRDDSEPHFLAELSAAVAALPEPRRYLVAEDNRNLRRLLLPRDAGGYGIDAVWADDFHHQVRNLAAGDTHGYYADYAGTTLEALARTVRQGWFYTGQHSSRRDRPWGTDPTGLPKEQFVFCIQNHDQIGNRAGGDRLHHEIALPVYRAVSALLLFAPQLPLLFMGQEWATSAPFQYFTDHNEMLGPLVTEGRKNEFEGIADAAHEVPDPQAPSTFERSRLVWGERDAQPHAGVLRLYRDLLALRRRLAGDVRVEVSGRNGLSLRRGRHAMLVALEDERSMPLPEGGRLVLATEQPEYAADGRPPRVANDRVDFPTAGAAVFVLPDDRKRVSA